MSTAFVLGALGSALTGCDGGAVGEARDADVGAQRDRDGGARCIACEGPVLAGPRDAGSACDGGALLSPDGECPGLCGDGIVELSEACDDENDQADDGCDGCQLTASRVFEGRVSAIHAASDGAGGTLFVAARQAQGQTEVELVMRRLLPDAEALGPEVVVYETQETISAVRAAVGGTGALCIAWSEVTAEGPLLRVSDALRNRVSADGAQPSASGDFDVAVWPGRMEECALAYRPAASPTFQVRGWSAEAGWAADGFAALHNDVSGVHLESSNSGLILWYRREDADAYGVLAGSRFPADGAGRVELPELALVSESFLPVWNDEGRHSLADLNEDGVLGIARLMERPLYITDGAEQVLAYDLAEAGGGVLWATWLSASGTLRLITDLEGEQVEVAVERYVAETELAGDSGLALTDHAGDSVVVFYVSGGVALVQRRSLVGKMLPLFAKRQ